ncbi:ATP-binding protein, partial [Vibrio tubiashii]
IRKVSFQLKMLPTRQKIYYASKHDKPAFEDFVFVFTSIFPQVKKIKPFVYTHQVSPGQTRKSMIINLEMSNGSTIPQASISSGMFKTMLVLAEIHFGNNGSPIIIDEIENSLGVNCLPDVLSELEVACNQVIMTSHHPRVINVIPTRYWKVVQRDSNGTVNAYLSNSVIDKNSSHDTFFQLLNSDLYNGIS